MRSAEVNGHPAALEHETAMIKEESWQFESRNQTRIGLKPRFHRSYLPSTQTKSRK